MSFIIFLISLPFKVIYYFFYGIYKLILLISNSFKRAINQIAAKVDKKLKNKNRYEEDLDFYQKHKKQLTK